MKRTILTAFLLLTLMLFTACSAEEKASSSVEATPSTVGNKTESRIKHEWIDADGDIEEDEEYEEIIPIEEYDLDTIFSDFELTERFFDSNSFDIQNYDVDTILAYPQLKEFCIEHYEFEDFAEWFDTDFSTCFSGVAYSPIFEILAVEFLDSGSVYYYYDVPREIGEHFVESDTLGEDYNEYIKGQYYCERMN